MAAFELSGVSAVDLSKSTAGINTGVGFFDHMLDQLNSHAQVGVSVTAAASAPNADLTDRNRHAEPADGQADLMSAVGAALGLEIGELVSSKQSLTPGKTSRFCCPLDEALVECVLTVGTGAGTGGKLETFTLSPYGIYPSPGGRTRIGTMVPAHLEGFFSAMAESSGLQIALRKVRGDNGHHVVESAFKAFSRSLRNLLDGTDTSGAGLTSAEFEALWGLQSDSYKQSLELARTASLSRKTKETSIDVNLQLDWMHAGVAVSTGLPTLDRIFSTLAEEAKVSLSIECAGDTWVDDHHTTEDVAIATGQCLNKALGTKAGLNRMWCAQADSGGATVEVTMDLSNRPCLTHNLALSRNAGGEEYVGGDACALSIEMFEHALDSLVMNGQMTVHIVQVKEGAKVIDTALATAAAFGRALKLCCAVDPRRAGKTASSKGTLSL
mmetsp:Transcript_6637/g.14532  ORF Transcript_6637/g.14532 Transcript_6637/m.14532 type:complete len:440 (+) Transcript_6637:110-1429(+)|eukprot:CAMPEP_0178694696 /NCGR_PEP_ID=MMETSP0699-20121125/8400_1 /TAXON_ID=265572 /ORGANISM="Extubocellulus spinifer, Strain CCMP396" /LENGTH=439 /DNA_ID=CAMNT_0020340225 /DNA_START=139 /DNA_END=1458 /DNA_ORIENTATION=-